MSLVMTCGTCGHEIDEIAMYCSNCGALVPESDPNADTEELMPSEHPTTLTKRPGVRVPRWKIFLVEGAGAQESYILRMQNQIGRDEKNSIRLPDSRVSRNHAVIEYTSDGFAIQDLGSTNGTFINQQPVTAPQILRVGDILSVGSYRFIILRDIIKCRNCGHSVSSGDHYCKHCGIKLTGP